MLATYTDTTGSYKVLLDIQPIPLGVTFSNADSKLKARTSLFTETWQQSHSTFELSKMSPQVGLAVPSFRGATLREGLHTHLLLVRESLHKVLLVLTRICIYNYE